MKERARALKRFFSEQLHICGCGQPETAAVLVRDILRLCPLYDHRELFEMFPTTRLTSGSRHH